MTDELDELKAAFDATTPAPDAARKRENIALAENDHDLAEQALSTATRLAATVERRYELDDVALSDAEPGLFADLGKIDMLVLECASLGSAQVKRASDLAEALGVARVLVSYQYCNERWLQATEDRGYTATSFPPDPAYLAYEMSRSIAEKATGLGEANLGELMASRPRRFTEEELSAARGLQSGLNCECPRHITDLIRSLASFEEYSATCSVENWHDAAVHSCIYAYTTQARWLMEKALGAVLEEHADSFGDALRAQRGGRLNDAA